jgi:hypothetical protein
MPANLIISLPNKGLLLSKIIDERNAIKVIVDLEFP